MADEDTGEFSHLVKFIILAVMIILILVIFGTKFMSWVQSSF